MIRGKLHESCFGLEYSILDFIDAFPPYVVSGLRYLNVCICLKDLPCALGEDFFRDKTNVSIFLLSFHFLSLRRLIISVGSFSFVAISRPVSSAYRKLFKL